MANPKFIEEEPVSLVEVRNILHNVEKRDEELNYRSGKAKDFLDNFNIELTVEKQQELSKKLISLNLTRLKEIHIAKIIDFLPKNADELKVIMQAYPVSFPKKDQEAIIGAVKDFV